MPEKGSVLSAEMLLTFLREPDARERDSPSVRLRRFLRHAIAPTSKLGLTTLLVYTSAFFNSRCPK
jgi:hypothetical protein